MWNVLDFCLQYAPQKSSKKLISSDRKKTTILLITAYSSHPGSVLSNQSDEQQPDVTTGRKHKEGDRK